MSAQDIDRPQDMGVNDIRTVEISGLAAGGRGVARREGQVWFVAGGLPGDVLEAQVLRLRRRAVDARLVQLVRGSALRREPPCPFQARCGGCPWMALDEPEQLRFKRQLVADALARIGGLKGIEIEAVRPASRVLGYRNRVEFTLGRDPAGEAVLGLHQGEQIGPGLLDIPTCALLHDDANRVLETARRVVLGAADRWSEARDGEEPYRLLLRRSDLSGEMVVVIREAGRPFPVAVELAEALASRHPEVVGVVRVIARPGARGGARLVPVWGRTWIAERVGALTLRLPASSFLQVHAEMREVLLQTVVESAGPQAGHEILDLYGGLGVFGLGLAAHGARVAICEADAQAVACGREAAAEQGLSEAVRFRCADVRLFLEERARSRAPVDLVVANPPRTGLGRGVVEALARVGPRRLVLVSCDPPTLARDLRGLGQRGLRVERVVPIDMFPQTAHVEVVATLRADPPA
jgi:23S rRNA (uracil1939-C5)-methyltransferase